MTKRDPMRWVRLGITGVTLVLGWVFIFWHNKFHFDPPAVVVALAYLAVVLAIANLWRVGAAAVSDDHGDDTWERPLGARDELEKEKRTLLKAIKESEFDLETGKLSKGDADALIQMYRARAIEVIKEIERLDHQSEADAAATPRQKIEREIAARLALAEKTSKKKDRSKADEPAATSGSKKATTASSDAASRDGAKAAAATEPTSEASAGTSTEASTETAKEAPEVSEPAPSPEPRSATEEAAP